MARLRASVRAMAREESRRCLRVISRSTAPVLFQWLRCAARLSRDTSTLQTNAVTLAALHEAIGLAGGEVSEEFLDAGAIQERRAAGAVEGFENLRNSIDP